MKERACPLGRAMLLAHACPLGLAMLLIHAAPPHRVAQAETIWFTLAFRVSLCFWFTLPFWFSPFPLFFALPTSPERHRREMGGSSAPSIAEHPQA